MTLLILHAMLLIGLTTAYDYDYDDKKCETYENPDTDETFRECLCENRENITINPIFEYDITRITIKGCGTVRVPFAALNSLQLEYLEFIDLEKLFINPFALSSVHGIQILKIADVADLVIAPHAFAGLHNVVKLLLDNVTVNTLSEVAFSSITNINHFMIENSIFRNVEQFAFVIHNVTYFSVNNSEFHSLENCSFLLHNSDEVIFENCHFEKTENGSFLLPFVYYLYFKNCTFGEIATTSFHSNALQVFSLTNSVIEELKPDAFGGLEVHDKIIFTNNTIQIVYETSLNSIIRPPFPSLEVYYCCNTFSCDCNIYWMWNLKGLDENSSLLENSRCTSDTTATLSDYAPVMDSYNTCMTIELKTFHNIPFLNETAYASSFSLTLECAFKTILCILIITKLSLGSFIL